MGKVSCDISLTDVSARFCHNRQFFHSYVTGETVPQQRAICAKVRERVLDEAVTDTLHRMGVSTPAKDIRNECNTAAQETIDDPFATTRMYSKVTRAYFTYVADNADWNSDQLRSAGTHVTVVIARGIYLEDPDSCPDFVAALAHHEEKSRASAPRTSVPTAVADGDDGVLFASTMNPPSAALSSPPKALLMRVGDGFELATKGGEEEDQGLAGFSDEFGTQPFTEWMSEELRSNRMQEDEFKVVNADLVCAAGKRLSWEEATAAHASLAKTFTSFEAAKPGPAKTMRARRIGSCGEIYSKNSYELAYALSIALSGAEETPSPRDHARRLLHGEKLTHAESVEVFRPILLNPTSEEAAKAVLKMVIEAMDAAKQQTTMLTIDGGLFKKHAMAVYSDATLRGRMFVNSGDFHLLKAAMAGIMRKMRGAGLAELLVKAGAFDGEAAASSALNGSHVNNGMWAHSLLYQCYQSTNLRSWLEEEEDSGAIDAMELARLKVAVTDFEAGGPDAVAAMAAGEPISLHLARFRAHQIKLASRSGQAKLHLQYVNDVETILLHKRLIRQPGRRDFKPYLSSLEQLHILCCSGDRGNYARILACQIRNWEMMPKLFPELYSLVGKGLCSALISTNERAVPNGPAGGGKSHDLMIEKMMARIKDAKAGVNAFAGSTDRLAAWFGAWQCLADLSDRASVFAPVTARNMTKGKANELYLRRNRTRKDAVIIDAVDKLLAEGFNPFEEVSSELWEDMDEPTREEERHKVYHLTSHAELEVEAAKQLLLAHSLGAERSRAMLNRLRKDSGEKTWDHSSG